MKVYSVPSGSCYLEVVKIRYKNDKYIKAVVRWYSKATKAFLVQETIKTPLKCFGFWEETNI